MRLYPAIDISDGKAVRLTKGDFDAKTVYEDDPLEAARAWVAAGARHLHVVDLDGAKEGKPQNLHHLERMTKELGVPIQYGGGLRDIGAVRDALRAGAQRVILGTAAFRDVDLLDAAIQQYGSRVMVSVDVRGGHVATSGWTETSALPAPDAIVALQDRGVRSFVYTDADRDGMLDGPDLEDVQRIAGVVRGRWIYSGGIGTTEHLRALAKLRLVNLAGAISGKALYERAFSIADGMAALN